MLCQKKTERRRMPLNENIDTGGRDRFKVNTPGAISFYFELCPTFITYNRTTNEIIIFDLLVFGKVRKA